MSLPSCNLPPAFSAFRREAARPAPQQPAPGPILGLFEDSPDVRDTFLDPNHTLSLKTAATLFMAGFGVSLAGGKAFRGMLARTGMVPKEGAARLRIEKIKAEGTGEVTHEMNTAQSLDGLASVFVLATGDPSQRRGLLTYVGTSILGYLAGSAAQGSQEAWVRREETRIRADLINRLQQAFRQSIRDKYAFDAQLKEEARARILNLLQGAGVPNAALLMQTQAVVEPPGIYQRYFYEPTHRTVMPPAFRGVAPLGTGQGQPLESTEKKPFWLLKSALVGAGLLTGFTVQAFMRLFTGHLDKEKFPGKIINYFTLRIGSNESLSLHGVSSRQNFFIMAGFFAMSAAAKLGKLFVDGLREIEVTRLNAGTELAYQTHNWITQDPSFHRIAETEALNNSLTELAQDLPALKMDPAGLQKRIQAILANVGRNSAPKYFPMTPTVGLREARS